MEDQHTSATAQRIAEVVGDILGRPVGLGDNLFDVGGDSLTAFSLVARLRSLGLEIRAREIFEQPVVEQMAQLARPLDMKASSSSSSSQGNTVQSAPIPLLPMQAEFFDICDGDLDWNFIPVVVELINPTLSGADLADRIAGALRPHHALSVAFRKSPFGWQQFACAEPITCEVDFLSTGGHDSEAGWAETVLDQLRPEIDIQAGRPVVARLVHTDSQRSYLFLLCHHLVVDALSLRRLADDVRRVIAEPFHLADQHDPAIDFATMAEQMRQLADSPGIQGELGYWKSLPLSQGTMIAADHPGNPHSEATSASVGIRLSRDRTAGLVHLARSQGLYLGDLVTVAAGTAAMDVLRCDVVAIDTAIHGRDLQLPGVSMTEAVGWLAANVPTVLSRDLRRPADALASIRHQMSSRVARGHGYSLLKHMASASISTEQLRSQPRPLIATNYVGSTVSAFAQVNMRPVQTDNFTFYDPAATRSYLFEIEASMPGQQLSIRAWYGSELFDHATSVALLKAIRRALLALGAGH